MNEKKYELTSKTITRDGHTLHLIKALRDFGNVCAGDFGGYIEREENLSQDGNCWVYNDAKVYEDAKVSGCATLHDNAIAGGHARIGGHAEVSGEVIVRNYAKVYENAKVSDRALITSNCKVYGNARVCTYAEMYGNAEVYGYATLCGAAVMYEFSSLYDNAVVKDNSILKGTAKVRGSSIVVDSKIGGGVIVDGIAVVRNANIWHNEKILMGACINSDKDYFAAGPLGSRSDYTTFYLGRSGNIMVACGCFNDTIDRFEERVRNIHGKDKHYYAYMSVIKVASEILKDRA